MSLRSLRWAVRGVLVLGMSASVAANVLHADPNPISKTIAAWPPIALLLAIELVTHVPVHRRAVTWGRRVATLVLAGIAAYVSYWHMAGVAERYGETGLSVYLLPFSVDGLIAVASICLVEISGRLRAENTESVPAPAPVPVPVLAAVPEYVPVPASVPVAARVADDDVLLEELRQVPGPLTVRQVRERWRVGATRAQRLLAQLGTTELEGAR